MEPLPRGDVREFENWLLRELVFEMQHSDRLKREGKEGLSLWMAVGGATKLSAALGHYTDRDPGALQKAALIGYRELRQVIDEGTSFMAELERQYEAREEKDK